MTPVAQRNQHRPDEGVWGDCHRACIASLLDLPYEEVPHICDGGPSPQEFWRREREFFLSRGLVPLTVAYQAELPGVLRAVAHANPDVYYLLGGRSTTGCGHTVVCLNERVVHNPNGAEIVGPMDDGLYYVTFVGSVLALRRRDGEEAL